MIVSVPPSARQWGGVRIRIEEPSNGHRYCYDVVVIYGEREVRYSNLEDDTRWWRAAYWWLRHPMKRWRLWWGGREERRGS